MGNVTKRAKSGMNWLEGWEWRGIHHGAFEEGLDRINRINRIIGVGWKAFDMTLALPSLGSRGSTQFC
jgi:hypothetical protein